MNPGLECAFLLAAVNQVNVFNWALQTKLFLLRSTQIILVWVGVVCIYFSCWEWEINTEIIQLKTPTIPTGWLPLFLKPICSWHGRVHPDTSHTLFPWKIASILHRTDRKAAPFPPPPLVILISSLLKSPESSKDCTLVGLYKIKCITGGGGTLWAKASISPPPSFTEPFSTISGSVSSLVSTISSYQCMCIVFWEGRRWNCDPVGVGLKCEWGSGWQKVRTTNNLVLFSGR